MTEPSTTAAASALLLPRTLLPVLAAFIEAVNAADMSDKITVTQTGCIGMCQYEPVVEVYVAGQEKVTYVKMDAERAKKVVEEHLIGGKVVTEYTINNSL